jgi:oligopeptide transport system ATP-binding protein
MTSMPLLEVCDLTKYFLMSEGMWLQRRVKLNRAVDGVSFAIRQSETLGLVGESGSGKSTIGRVILRLLEPTSGEVYYAGNNILLYSKQEMRLLRREMQMIFQDPYTVLNPCMTAGSIITEPLRVHGLAKGSAREERLRRLMDIVGLAWSYRHRYPHQFSGGQRQRIGIARALAVNPKFVICDEPVSALDVSIQAQIMNLLQDLQQEYRLTYLFISHDLAVVKHISDRVAVIYLGKVVEIAPRDELFTTPQHPYTQALLSAIPSVDPHARRTRFLMTGDANGQNEQDVGCRFHARCPKAKAVCSRTIPKLAELKAGHFVACHLAM